MSGPTPRTRSLLAFLPMLCCLGVLASTRGVSAWLGVADSVEDMNGSLRQGLATEYPVRPPVGLEEDVWQGGLLSYQAWEATGKIRWAATTVLVVVGALVSLAMTLVAVARCDGAAWAWCVLACGAVAMALAWLVELRPFGMVSGGERQVPMMAAAAELLRLVDRATRLGNALLAAAVTWVGLGLWRLLRSVPQDVDGLRRCSRGLDLMLYSTAALLIGATVENSTLYEWLFRVPLGEGRSLTAFAGFSQSGGFLCTLLAFALFAPAVLLVREDARRMARREATGAKEPAGPKQWEEWLERHGIRIAARSQALRSLATLAPALTAISGLF